MDERYTQQRDKLSGDKTDGRSEHVDRDEPQPNSLGTAEALAARERQPYAAGADGTQQIPKPEGARAPSERPPLDSNDTQP